MVLVLGVVGVVYGDIGISLLYMFKEVFGLYGVLVLYDNVFGVLSLVFWLLIFVVLVKYLLFIM